MMEMFSVLGGAWATPRIASDPLWTWHEPRRIYAAYHNPMYYESAAGIISLHRTKAGAYRAMRAHLLAEYARWYDNRIRYGKECNRGGKFGAFECWFVSEMEIGE
jgi:hypothetical protein